VRTIDRTPCIKFGKGKENHSVSSRVKTRREVTGQKKTVGKRKMRYWPANNDHAARTGVKNNGHLRK